LEAVMSKQDDGGGGGKRVAGRSSVGESKRGDKRLTLPRHDDVSYVRSIGSKVLASRDEVSLDEKVGDAKI
jgi:hypothetical protein